jgi:hypothetical protein
MVSMSSKVILAEAGVVREENFGCHLPKGN